MPPPKPPFTGSCLCGAVTLTATAAPLLTVACHCTGCRKLAASDHSLTTMFPADAVTVTGELTQGGFKTPARDHFYCASCLSFVLSRLAFAPERINISTGILDAERDLPPSSKS